MSKVNLENVVAKDQALAAAIAKGDTAVGALLNQRHNEIVNGETKAIVRFFKPLGDLLCKLRAGLEADQKQIPSKTEAEASEAEEQNEVLIERGSVSLGEIAREALLQCELHGHDVSALVKAIDAELLAMLDEVHPEIVEAA